MSGFFISGTDTGVGKTLVTLGLMNRCKQHGKRVLGMKPVASGCEVTAEGLRNSDALQIQQAGSQIIAYEKINPYAFAPPIAPHIAAQQSGRLIDISLILDHFAELESRSDLVIVEGVGGWEVPLGDDIGMPELAAKLGLPVILVVGIRLGCINHALLTVSAIRATALELAGWVANCVDPDVAVEGGILQSLQARIDAPLLGRIPWLEDCSADRPASYLDGDICR